MRVEVDVELNDAQKEFCQIANIPEAIYARNWVKIRIAEYPDLRKHYDEFFERLERQYG